MARWRVIGINFDHMHMGDLLRNAFDHPDVNIVGVCDRQADRTKTAVAAFGIAPELVFTDVGECIRQTKPDLVVLCPATADHAVAYEACCSFGVDVLMEKPFAANIRDARRMLDARDAAGTRLAINWPSRWFPAHVTTKRLIDEGTIGQVTQVHYYGGNRGPLYHLADKVEVSDNEVQRKKSDSWWYKKESGGGSLLDYLGYGATLGTWFMDGRAPLKVTTVTSAGEGIEVDEHSITICQYTTGLSKFETRWGTFTDPWTIQPQPRCGFVVVGTEGTISSYDYDPHVGVQTKDRREVTNIPADVLQSPYRNPIEYVFHCKKNGMPVTGPLDPVLCFTAQRIIDTAVESAKQGKTLDLLG
ncbi:Glucose--fructose oxidoreductase [Colletotrichum sp. SAR 10_70]|nr:Glucose--fructose oxidoreductase [Colletotrichum sp. SAR 10_71]KAI8169478.1 Glucose--fructose oxidoreductase [Colletotrichum sp. SAR 10_70]KAI8177982.1 Glucose--fructose oxidoreductase [Colletotrichum sp. SAR 10_75]KAI8209050.1 Glucose--fructose oxidoreductase [Colletotrichum sp. SAR 10_65]